MNSLINKNQLTLVKEHEFDQPISQRIDSVNDNCYRDCQNKYFHTFEYICVCDNQLTNISHNEIVTLTIDDKSKN